MSEYREEEKDYVGFGYVLDVDKLTGYSKLKFRPWGVIRKRGEEVHRFPDPQGVPPETYDTPEEAMEKGRIQIYSWVNLHGSN